MKPADLPLVREIESKLLSFGNAKSLPGIQSPQSRACLVEQIIDSIRRIKYVKAIGNKTMSSFYCDATTEHFDPLKASVWQKQNGNIDEAFWLIFLATHFGKNGKTGWGLARGTYGAMRHPVYWDWDTTKYDTNAFKTWLYANRVALKRMGNFSNHRKYQSLDAHSATGTGAAVASYISWVGNDHMTLISNVQQQVGNNPRLLFNALFKSMNSVASFGRIARFDYLTMIGKIGLLDIEPDSTYMEGATGPKSGAKLLFGGSTTSPISDVQLNNDLIELEAHLNLEFGMQVLEDALCNWQKNPFEYSHFTG